MTKEELENYEPKGDLTGFPKEVITYLFRKKKDMTLKDVYELVNKQISK